MVKKKTERIQEETSLSGDQGTTGMEESECKEESGASPCDERGWLSESVDARGEGDRLLLQKVWVKRCSWSTVIPSEEND